MLESKIEVYLIKRCKEIGALCDKFTSPQRRSVPDRLITFNGRVLFVELKATGKKPTEAQVRDHERRRAAGAEVVWLDNIEECIEVECALVKGRPVMTDGNYKVIC